MHPHIILADDISIDVVLKGPGSERREASFRISGRKELPAVRALGDQAGRSVPDATSPLAPASAKDCSPPTAARRIQDPIPQKSHERDAVRAPTRCGRALRLRPVVSPLMAHALKPICPPPDHSLKLRKAICQCGRTGLQNQGGFDFAEISALHSVDLRKAWPRCDALGPEFLAAPRADDQIRLAQLKLSQPSAAKRRKRPLRESVQGLAPVMPLDRSKRLWRQMSSTTDPRLCRSSRNREQDKEGCSVWGHAFGP